MNVLLLMFACATVPRAPGPLGIVGLDSRGPAVAANATDEGEPHTVAPPDTREAADGQSVADAARFYLEHRPRGFRDDCSGYVCAVYDRLGHDLDGNTETLWNLARDLGATHKRKRPQIGDLAFFDNTYDRNGNGRRDDALTHVAVVLEVQSDGTVLLAHGGTSKGRTTMRMNLRYPGTHKDPNGRELNSYLRSRNAEQSGKRLSGELFRGFATLRLDEAEGMG